MARSTSGRAASNSLRLVAVSVALATVVRLGGRRVTWLSAPAVAFTPYLIPLAVVGGILAALRRQRLVALTLTACAAALTLVVRPRTRPTSQPAPGSDPVRLKIMSANVLLGRANPEALVGLVREHEPDVLAIQEQNPKYLKELTRAGLFELMPHRVLGSGHRLQDAGIISRFPLTAIAPELPSVYAAATVQLPGGAEVPIISAHPLPPMPRKSEALWVGWLKQLPSPVGVFAGAVVAGDFNSSVDHAEFRQVLRRGWRDAAGELGQGLRPTWRGLNLLWVLQLTIDHVLVPPGAIIESYRVDSLTGSDHDVVTVTLLLPR